MTELSYKEKELRLKRAWLINKLKNYPHLVDFANSINDDISEYEVLVDSHELFFKSLVDISKETYRSLFIGFIINEGNEKVPSAVSHLKKTEQQEWVYVCRLYIMINKDWFTDVFNRLFEKQQLETLSRGDIALLMHEELNKTNFKENSVILYDEIKADFKEIEKKLNE